MSYSYTDITKVKEEIRASSPFSSATTPSANTVTRWITEVSEVINRDAGQVFGTTAYTEVIDYNGEELIALENAPIISVTNLLYTTSDLGTSGYALSGTATEGTDYSAYEKAGEILILPNTSKFRTGNKTMQVNYTAGYATTPLDVQQLATKTVALQVLNSLLQQNVDQANTGGSVSVGSINIVEPADVGVGTYKSLQSDITELRNRIATGYKTIRYSNRLVND